MTCTPFTRPRPRKSLAAGLLMLAMLAGCDSFISTEPLGELTTEDFFVTEEHAIQATNATYNVLRGWQIHVFSWIGMTDIVSDDATKGSVPADASFLLDLDNLNFDPGNIAFRDTWDGYYQGIYRANVAILNIPNVEGDEGLKQRLIAENKFLRAYFYFFLVRAFGGVPLITEPLEPGEFEQPRASAEEVYNLIEQDLTDAIAVLPDQYGAADIGRATRGAAQALLAEVYLFQGDYASALQNAQAVINSGVYNLYPSFSELFSPAGESSSESVFEVPSIALEQGGGGSQYSQVQGVRGTPNLGWGFNTPSDQLEASFEPGDPRLQATIMYPWELLPDGSNLVVYLNPSMPNNRYNQKVFIPENTPGGTGNGGANIRRIRYAQVLLTAAEAAYHEGDIGSALTYLNEVRRRARAGRSLTLGFSPEQLGSSIAIDRLGLDASASRVFVRFVDPASDAYAAGLRSFASECADDVCAAAAVPPVRVTSIDLIQSVDGVPVATTDEYFSQLASKSAGQPVTIAVVRMSQEADGSTSAQPLTATITAQELLPDVTASGQDLLDAIWRERRAELAMEQHRWFDIIRQGRAAELMAAAGLNFVEGKHELYPIPLGEVEIAGLQQNPGY